MCDDINCCQCYKTKEYAFASWDDSEENEKWEKLEEAVDATKNQVITYNGGIISAFFHAHSGGKTENVKFVWGGTKSHIYKALMEMKMKHIKMLKNLQKKNLQNV